MIFRQRCVLRVCLAKNKKMRLKNNKDQLNLRTKSSENNLEVEDTNRSSVEVVQPIDANDIVEDEMEVNDLSELDSNVDTTCSKIVQLYECSKCGKKFSKKPYATKHCEVKPTWKCPKCGLVINYRTNSRRHLKTCQATKNLSLECQPPAVTKTIKCARCTKTFSSIGNLRRHERDVHNVIIFKTYICPVSCCPFSTTEMKYMKSHQKVVHSPKNIKCNNCEHRCGSSAGMRRHRINVHGVECSYCQKKFSTPLRLEVHINTTHRADTNSGSLEVVVSRRLGEHSTYRYRPSE